MVDYVSTNQVPESASDNNIRVKVPTRGNPACTDGQGKSVRTELDWFARILGCNHLGKSPSCNCVARGKRTIGFVVSGALGPEPSATVTFVRPLAIGRELQHFHDKQGVRDRLRSQPTCVRKVTIVGCQPEQVEPARSSHRPVQADIGDCVTRVDPRLVNPEFLLCLRIVVKRNSSGSGEGYKPKRVSRLDPQRACPNAGLIVTDLLEALSKVTNSTYRTPLNGTVLGTLGFGPRPARGIPSLPAS